MIKLSKAIIRDYASDETMYQRGYQLFMAGKVVNASYSSNTQVYHMTVKDIFDYQVMIQLTNSGNVNPRCNCSAHAAKNTVCKHEVAALFALLRYLEKTDVPLPKTEDEKRAGGVLDYFDSLSDAAVTKEIYHIEPIILIPNMLRDQKGYAYVLLTVGNTKMYKVQSIKRFLEDYIRGETILLGKEFRFTPDESAFDSISREFLGFLLSIYDLSEFVSGTTPVFNRSQVVLSKYLFIKLLHLCMEMKFKLELYGTPYEQVGFIKGNPNIEMDLVDMEDTLTLDFTESETIIPLTENGELLYRDGFIYEPEKRFLKNFLPFFTNLGIGKAALTFRGDQRKHFLEQVLPKLHDSLEIQIPQELMERYLSSELAAEIYLDKYYGNIKAEVIFCYDNFRFNSFSEPKTDEFILLRKKDKEAEVLHYLEQNGFEAFSGFYLLRNDNAIYRFLTELSQQPNAYTTLFYSDALKSIFRKKHRSFAVSIDSNKDSGLLDMSISYSDVEKDELRELFRSYRLKKKFYRLKNGDFIDLEDSNIETMMNILEDVNLSYKNIDDDAHVSLPNSFAVYLDERFQNALFETEKSNQFCTLISAISKDTQEEYLLPEGILTELRTYQVTGFRWLCTLADNHLGGILADDMGLGKTLQAIVYIKYMQKRDNTNRFLIICPTSLAYNWQDEIENFAPDMKTVVITGTPQERKDLVEQNIDKAVLITTYPLMRRDYTIYTTYRFHTVFIDEAQFIKNYTSINAVSVKKIEADHKFALTGTPIENSLSELWSIFDFILPYYLFGHTKFLKQYEKPIQKEDTDALERLNAKIRPFVMRRMKQDVLKELPDKYETKLLTEMTEEQTKVYLAFVENARNDIQDEIKKNGFERSKMHILAVLTRLRQICCHPATFIENYTGESGKLNLFLQILPELISSGHRIIVFSQFTSMLDIINNKIKELDISCFYMNGGTKVSERSQMVKDFNNGICSIFLVSIRTGGTGLNLVGADTVIHFDPWWNPAVEDQATDRTHRIGQTNSVHVIKLITKDTIEEKIYKLQKKKKDLSDAVILAKEVFINMLTQEEIEELLQ